MESSELIKSLDIDGDIYSRYKHCKRFYYSDGVADVETLPQVVIEQSTDDKFFRVTDKFENRLDLISYKYYKTVQLWWLIAYASNILNPFDVPVGTVLRIPTIQGVILDEVV